MPKPLRTPRSPLLAVEQLEDRRVLASAWHNLLAPLNVDDMDRRTVSPIDALLVINELTDRTIGDEFGKLPESPAGFSVPPYLDVTDDGFVSPLDALLVINALSEDPQVPAAIESELADILATSPGLMIGEMPAEVLGVSSDSREFVPAEDASDVPPAVVKTSDGGTVLVWVGSHGQNLEQVLAQRFSAAGVPVGEPTVVATVEGALRSVDVGLTSNDGLIVTWAQRTAGDWDIYVKETSLEGQPIEPVLVNQTTLGTQRSPAIAVASNDDFAVVWQDERQTGRPIMGRFFGSAANSGELLLTPNLPDAPATSSLQPDIVSTQDGYFITWTTKTGSQARLMGLRVDSTGLNPLLTTVSDIDLPPTEISASSLAINSDGTYAAVVWQQRMSDRTGWDVRLRSFDLAAGVDPGPVVPVNAASLGRGEQPTIAVNDGHFIVAWNGHGLGDVAGQFLRRYDISGQDWLSTEAVFNEHARTEPILTTVGGNTMIASIEGDGRGIVARAFGENVRVRENDLVAFATALAESGTRFFGAAWCPHCTTQKELFEDGGPFLPFVEVTNPNRTPNQIGIDEHVTIYPTWKFPDESRLEGVQSLETLSERSGVAIPQSIRPIVVPIANATLLVGSPLYIPLDGYDPNGSELTYHVTSSNPDVTATLTTGNRSIRFDVNGFGDLVFQLFEDKAPLATARMIELATNTTRTVTVGEGDDAMEVEIPFYQDIIFHRVLNDFVIQAGDPNGTGSGGSNLGDFDDQFHVDLQHNRTGLLSMAKSGDDTNDSQFFVTEGTSRHLDFNHTIFGLLVEGEKNRAAISDTDTVGGRPVIGISIGGTEVFNDKENGVLMLKAAGGATGTSTITVIATDGDDLAYETSFEVTLAMDSANGGPFLTDFDGDFVTTTDLPVSFILESIDVEGDDVFYDVSTLGVDGQYAVEIDNQTGLVTVTPLSGFTGTISFLVGVRPDEASDTGGGFDFDAQEVVVEVLEAP